MNLTYITILAVLAFVVFFTQKDTKLRNRYIGILLLGIGWALVAPFLFIPVQEAYSPQYNTLGTYEQSPKFEPEQPCGCGSVKFEYTNDYDRLACMFPGQKNTCAMATQSSTC